MWDALYTTPYAEGDEKGQNYDVFLTLYQEAPLDLLYPSFCRKRS